MSGTSNPSGVMTKYITKEILQRHLMSLEITYWKPQDREKHQSCHPSQPTKHEQTVKLKTQWNGCQQTSPKNTSNALHKRITRTTNKGYTRDPIADELPNLLCQLRSALCVLHCRHCIGRSSRHNAISGDT